ncbi:hypothetical protein DFJ77DRAFT_462232 [Powellomyces hirtus]|nr:hypothetical protein DFJ77DRAFT_462232 [Powellomyces hirtus]
MTSPPPSTSLTDLFAQPSDLTYDFSELWLRLTSATSSGGGAGLALIVVFLTACIVVGSLVVGRVAQRWVTPIVPIHRRRGSSVGGGAGERRKSRLSNGEWRKSRISMVGGSEWRRSRGVSGYGMPGLGAYKTDGAALSIGGSGEHNGSNSHVGSTPGSRRVSFHPGAAPSDVLMVPSEPMPGTIQECDETEGTEMNELNNNNNNNRLSMFSIATSPPVLEPTPRPGRRGRTLSGLTTQRLSMFSFSGFGKAPAMQSMRTARHSSNPTSQQQQQHPDDQQEPILLVHPRPSPGTFVVAMADYHSNDHEDPWWDDDTVWDQVEILAEGDEDQDPVIIHTHPPVVSKNPELLYKIPSAQKLPHLTLEMPK